MATLNPRGLAELNTAFAEHFDGIQPLKGLTATFAGTNLQNVAQQLTYSGPATPGF